MSAFVWLFAILLASGFIVGVSSIGGNLFAIPLMALLIPPQDAIVVGSLSCIPVLVSVGLIYWRDLPWLDIAALCVASALATPLGAWLLAHAGSRALLICAGGAVALFLVWQGLAARLKNGGRAVSRLAAVPCGLAAGVMAASVGMGGPPLAMYAFWRHWDKKTTIGGCSLANGLQMLACVPAQGAVGLYSRHLLELSGWATVAALAGLLLSLPVLRYINLCLFRKIILGMLGLAALNMLARGLWL